jgi:hypothetical protein
MGYQDFIATVQEAAHIPDDEAEPRPELRPALERGRGRSGGAAKPLTLVAEGRVSRR